MKKSLVLLTAVLMFAAGALFAGEKAAAKPQCKKCLPNDRYACLNKQEQQIVKYSCGQKMFGKGAARGLFAVLQCPAEIFRSNTYYITKFYGKGKTFGSCMLPVSIVVGSADGLFGLVNRAMTGFWDTAMLGYYNDYDSYYPPFIWESGWTYKTWQAKNKVETKARLDAQRKALLMLIDVNRKLRLENQKSINEMLKNAKDCKVCDKAAKKDAPKAEAKKACPKKAKAAKKAAAKKAAAKEVKKAEK